MGITEVVPLLNVIVVSMLLLQFLHRKLTEETPPTGLRWAPGSNTVRTGAANHLLDDIG